MRRVGWPSLSSVRSAQHIFDEPLTARATATKRIAAQRLHSGVEHIVGINASRRVLGEWRLACCASYASRMCSDVFVTRCELSSALTKIG
jgi:hypothetical protein